MLVFLRRVRRSGVLTSLIPSDTFPHMGRDRACDPETEMSRRFYTILVLPHARARLRKFHLSRNFAVAVVCVLAVVALVGAMTPHLVFKVQGQSEAIDRLISENRALRDEKGEFEAALTVLSERISRFEGRASELASEMGMRDLVGTEPAAGGSLDAPKNGGLQHALDDDLRVLEHRADGADTVLGRLDQAWAERARVLAATPTGQPVPGFFSHGYGWRKDPFTGRREFHHGVDIVADTGTPILAPADGVVTRARRVAGYGKMVHLSHGYGMATRYGHLSEILVRPGQKVSRGDIVGRVGSTGRSTGPHLHYEVFKSGRRVDPRKYLGDKRF